MFLGVEAIDEEGLKKYRKRVTLSKNFEALEFARSLGIMVAINIIADPDWDRRQFEVIRQWCLEIPEIVNISVNTPYPGTESWLTESRRLTTRDYRLFDIQHAVLADPACRWPSSTASWSDPAGAQPQAPGLEGAQGPGGDSGPQPGPGPDQHAARCSGSSTAFTTRPSSLPTITSPSATRCHFPPSIAISSTPRSIYVHSPRGRHGRSIDDDTEQFVEQTRANGKVN